MRKNFKIIVYFVTLSTLFSCKWQPIYNAGTTSNSATISFAIDWTEANMELSEVSNVSIYAYTPDEVSPYLRISGNINSAYINLPVGTYSLLVFNDAVDDILGVSFSDSDSFDDFSANATLRSSTSDLYYDTTDNEAFASKLGRIAAWSQEEFEVTSEMVACSICEQESETIETIIDITPQSITRQCVVELSVDNLNNAQVVQATLIGFASGAYLSSGVNITSSVATTLYSVEMNSYTFSNDTDGSVKGETTIFGLSASTSTTYQIIFDIILGSGERVTYSREITDQVTAQDGTTIYIELSDDDDKIVLPESSGTGFGVDGWGDNEQIELL